MSFHKKQPQSISGNRSSPGRASQQSPAIRHADKGKHGAVAPRLKKAQHLLGMQALLLTQQGEQSQTASYSRGQSRDSLKALSVKGHGTGATHLHPPETCHQHTAAFLGWGRETKRETGTVRLSMCWEAGNLPSPCLCERPNPAPQHSTPTWCYPAPHDSLTRAKGQGDNFF